MAITMRNFELMQQLEYIDLVHMKSVLDSKLADGVILDYCYIVHDKDVASVDNDNIILKPAHIHCFVRLSGPRKVDQIAKWFNVESQYINKLKSTYRRCIEYLTHANDKTKYQYDITGIIASFDVKEKLSELDGSERLEDLLNNIDSGVINKLNYNEYMTIQEYAKWKTKIDNAFMYANDKSKRTLDRKMQVIFITGASGTGKTTYAKQLVNSKNLSCFVSSSENDVLYGYDCEQAIILDDLRPSTMSLSDLLKLLDNHTNSSVKARYHNKNINNCQLIVITSVLDIDTFFNRVFMSESEPVTQLKRRCQLHIRMTFDKIYCRVFDFRLMDYSKEYVTDNPVRSIIQEYQENIIDTQSFIHDMLGVDNLEVVHDDGFEKIEQLNIDDLFL